MMEAGSYQRLLDQCLDLSEQYEGLFAGMSGIRAAVVEREDPESLVLVSRNGLGKSTCVNVLFKDQLTDEVVAQYHLPRRLGEPVSVLLAALQAVLETQEHSPQVQVVRNPHPIEHADHLEVAMNVLKDYCWGSSSELAECSVLLPAGAGTCTTTQFQIRIMHDWVVAASIELRNSRDLSNLVQELLAELLEMIEDQESDAGLMQNSKFTQKIKLFAQLTNHDINAERSLEKRNLIDIVREHEQEDAAQRVRGNAYGLLSPALAESADFLAEVPMVFLGERKNLSSDLHFINQVLRAPMKFVLNNLPEERRRRVHLAPWLDDPDMQGMLVKRADCTVPFPALGPHLCFVDGPGLNDTRPFALYNISQALAAGDAVNVLAVIEKNLSADEGTASFLTNSRWPEKLVNLGRGSSGGC